MAPLINMDLFKIRDFNMGLLAVLFHFMVHTSFLLISAVYLQEGLRISALDSGLYYIFPGILFTAASFLASRMVVRYGKYVLLYGVGIMIITFSLQILLFKPGVNGLVIFFLMGSYGLGNGLVLPTLMNIALKSVPAKFAGSAAGVYTFFQQTASAFGVSIIGGLFFYFAGKHSRISSLITAFDYASMANIAGLLIVGLLLSLQPRSVKAMELDAEGLL